MMRLGGLVGGEGPGELAAVLSHCVGKYETQELRRPQEEGK